MQLTKINGNINRHRCTMNHNQMKYHGHGINYNEVKCQGLRIFNELQYLDKKESNQSTRSNEKTKRNPIKQWTEQRFQKGII